jgi:hypothetical protein
MKGKGDELRFSCLVIIFISKFVFTNGQNTMRNPHGDNHTVNVGIDTVILPRLTLVLIRYTN